MFYRYTVVEKWECDLREELKDNPEMKEFFTGIKIPEPLDPRESFYGGRTNATVLYHKVNDKNINLRISILFII